MYLFIDDNEGVSNRLTSRHDIFAYGGLLIKKEKLKEVESKFNSIKHKYHIPPYLPLKWNFKDNSLKKLYEDLKYYQLWKGILKKSKDIRRDVLNIFEELEIKVIFSSFRKFHRAISKPQYFYQAALTNILQRAFFESTPIEIIIDWEEKRREDLAKAYLWPYYFREGISKESFLSGCISNLQRSNPYVSFSITLYNPFLQLADIAVGCCGSFIEDCLKNKSKSLSTDLFTYLVKAIRGYKEGKIFSWGFVINPPEDKEKIEHKLIKLAVLNKRVDDSDKEPIMALLQNANFENPHSKKPNKIKDTFLQKLQNGIFRNSAIMLV